MGYWVSYSVSYTLHIGSESNTPADLAHTIGIPLVLGGRDSPKLITLSDGSLGTGPKGRSVIAYGTRLGQPSGFISVKVELIS
jgi:hypothetical protein